MFDYVGYSDGDIELSQRQLCSMPSVNNAVLGHMVIMFSDTVSDMEFGRNAGASNVGVLTGTAQHSELEPVADLVIASVAHFELN